MANMNLPARNTILISLLLSLYTSLVPHQSQSSEKSNQSKNHAVNEVHGLSLGELGYSNTRLKTLSHRLGGRRYPHVSCPEHFHVTDVDYIPSEIYVKEQSTEVDIRVEVQRETNFSIQVNITAINNSVIDARQQLEVQYDSPLSGYVQNAGWDGHSLYSNSIQVAVSIDITPGYVLMLSIPFFDAGNDGVEWGIVNISPNRCFPQMLSVYARSLNPPKVYPNVFYQWTVCGHTPLPPSIYDEWTLFKLIFRTGVKASGGRGFRLHFSFHPRNKQPQQLEDGRWNCSVPEWPSFKAHFPCNLVAECVNGEDEVVCPYYSDRCGLGRITGNSSCYRYITRQEVARTKGLERRICARGSGADDKTGLALSWSEAREVCARYQERLVSFPSPPEKQSVVDLLRYRRFTIIFTGLSSEGQIKSHMYKYMYQWEDGTIAFHLEMEEQHLREPPLSGHLQVHRNAKFFLKPFAEVAHADILCEESLGRQRSQSEGRGDSIQLSGDMDEIKKTWERLKAKYIVCPDEHKTHQFLACDVESACWDGNHHTRSGCRVLLDPLPLSYACGNGATHVPYTLVCDHRSDCADNSDETFCVFPICEDGCYFQCGQSKQCVPTEGRCNDTEECFNGIDELFCKRNIANFKQATSTELAILSYTFRGNFRLKQVSEVCKNSSSLDDQTRKFCNKAREQTVACPDTHFLCPGTRFCLPVYVLCNGVYDCPNHEDETDCDSYVCAGFYRCRGSRVCVHPYHLCNDIAECPQRDDELFCQPDCPYSCKCYGHAFFCSDALHLSSSPEVRFLEVPRTDMNFENTASAKMLIHLGMASCNLLTIQHLILPNLISLDLGGNRLTVIRAFDLAKVQNLRKLNLTDNPLSMSFVIDNAPEDTLPSLLELDLSAVIIERIDFSSLAIFPNLEILNLSGSGLHTVIGTGFQSTPKLRVLDVRGCPLERFPGGLLQGLMFLQKVYTDNYRLCCRGVLPEGFNVVDCHSPLYLFSSCEALLKSNVYRVCLSILAALTVLGNFGSFILRVTGLRRGENRSGFTVLVLHLSVADFLMGVYLSIVGVADMTYKDNYVYFEESWKHSGSCAFAGFLSLVSSEVSAVTIFLITLDRFLVLQFPFSQHRLRWRSGNVVAGSVWTTAVVFATVPLLPVASHWRLYSQTDICIPLPLSGKDSPGYIYSFAIMVVFNFFLFLLVAIGQFCIFRIVKSNRMPLLEVNQKPKDLTMARRLLSIAISDFLCWFPVGLLGLLSSRGVQIPGEVNVAIAIFVLPLNSALNPFLYTLNTLLEKRRLAQEQRLRQYLVSMVKAQQLEDAGKGRDPERTQS